jgi:hypothetical protein
MIAIPTYRALDLAGRVMAKRETEAAPTIRPPRRSA